MNYAEVEKKIFDTVCSDWNFDPSPFRKISLSPLHRLYFLLPEKSKFNRIQKYTHSLSIDHINFRPNIPFDNKQGEKLPFSPLPKNKNLQPSFPLPLFKNLILTTGGDPNGGIREETAALVESRWRDGRIISGHERKHWHEFFSRGRKG